MFTSPPSLYWIEEKRSNWFLRDTEIDGKVMELLFVLLGPFSHWIYLVLYMPANIQIVSRIKKTEREDY